MNSEKIKIFICTGNVHSGKTTKITEWANSRKRVDGILAPVVDSGRFLYRIKTKKGFLLNAGKDEKDDDIISIGHYKFNKNIFEWAQKELLKAFKLNPEWLIIDEIGFLELRNEGLEPAVSKILENRNSTDTKLLLIIRDNLMDLAVEHYKIKSFDYTFFEF